MKMKEFDFNSISQRGLAIFDDGKLIAQGFIGDVLKANTNLVNREIKETNVYFDEFVIRL